MAMLCAPVLLFVWTYFAYALINWRQREGDEEDGPPIHGNTKVQATWITVTAVIVLSLFVFGTVELIVPAGAGAGEGPLADLEPQRDHHRRRAGRQPAGLDAGREEPAGGAGHRPAVGVDLPVPAVRRHGDHQLLLPINTEVVLHVTSLDVIHSFWAYQLGVKADANPGVDNIAFFKPQAMGSFSVRCNELCGIWHGAMFNYGHVVSPAAFQTWASGVQAKEQADGLLSDLPPTR